MTITMTSKNQITLPKRITRTLGLSKGALFSIDVSRNRIELIPLETREKTFTKQMYSKLEALSIIEKGEEKPMSRQFIARLKNGKA